mgnify:CR=1 FL=1
MRYGRSTGPSGQHVSNTGFDSTTAPDSNYFFKLHVDAIEICGRKFWKLTLSLDILIFRNQN